MKTVKDETIIILQDERAIWCRWHDQRLIDRRVIEHCETIADSNLIPFDGISEIVKRFKRPTVGLIIDSSLDEVSSFMSTDAGIGRVARTKSNDTAHIHESLNRRCQLWLQKVQEQGVVFDYVTSTLRMLLRNYRKSKRQTLVVVDGDQLSRHVLCHRGRVVYARQCSKIDEKTSEEVLNESLDYLDDTASTQRISDCNIVYVGSNRASQDSLKERSTGPLVHVASTSATQWYFSLFRQRRWHIGHSASNRLLNRVLKGQLDGSESRRKLHRNDQKLFLATWLTVFIASITVIVACVHGFTVARYMRNVEVKSAALANDIVLTKESATEIHSFPVQAANALETMEAFGRIEKLDAAAVLTLVADAVTLHPGIQLDRLEWLLTDNEEALQWTGVASLEHAPVPRIIQQVSKQSLDESAPARLRMGAQIAIEGSVHEATLRGKQALFNGFVNTLETTPNIASVEVVTSPLEHAATSELKGSDFQFSIQIFHWPS